MVDSLFSMKVCNMIHKNQTPTINLTANTIQQTNTIYIYKSNLPNEKGAEVKLSKTDPSSVTYVNVCAINSGSSGSTIGGGKLRPTC